MIEIPKAETALRTGGHAGGNDRTERGYGASARLSVGYHILTVKIKIDYSQACGLRMNGVFLASLHRWVARARKAERQRPGKILMLPATVGGMALYLGVAGSYGVISFSVSARRLTDAGAAVTLSYLRARRATRVDPIEASGAE